MKGCRDIVAPQQHFIVPSMFQLPSLVKFAREPLIVSKQLLMPSVNQRTWYVFVQKTWRSPMRLLTAGPTATMLRQERNVPMLMNASVSLDYI